VSEDNDFCEVVGCAEKVYIIFLGHRLCLKHFDRMERRLERKAEKVLGVKIGD
jgi:hypothetical protein